MNPIKKTFTLGNHQVTFETGEIARQAHGAVICTMDDTVVLATVVGSKTPKAGQDWFPLTVDYAERTYAAGKIPGGFFKREGRPSEGNADLEAHRPADPAPLSGRFPERGAGRRAGAVA